jgi:PAS domain S-box-containing protein
MLNIDQIEKQFFKQGNPFKKLLKITLDLLNAEQVGVLYGTDASKMKYLPTTAWDRGVMDRFDGRGTKGAVLKYFGKQIVTLKKLSPVYFYKEDESGQKVDRDGVISYMLRTCANYYRQGISILFCPDISTNIYKIGDQYACIPFYSYDGKAFSEPDIKVKVDLDIIKHFQAKNYVSVYIPDYGILVVNTADPYLMDKIELGFVREKELKEKFDILIRLVEIVSLAGLGQLKGSRGAQLLWHKEKMLRQTSKELVENEKRYRDLYEHAPIAYFSMDREGAITKCNQNATRLSGYTRDQLIGLKARDLYVQDESTRFSPDQIQAILDQGKSIRDVEMKFKDRENNEIWTSVSLDALKDENDEILEMRAMVIDISSRKALEKQLVQAQKMEAVGTLAGGIAHDFNNILTPIKGYSEMLLMEAGDDTSKRTEQLKIIYDCAKYAKGLVNQMLTFSRQKENELKLIKPHLFVKDALVLARSFIPATVEMKENINEECGLLMVDPIQAHQVVMNLISNAFHAMEDEGGVLEIYLDEKTIDEESMIFPLKPGAYIYLKIADTGPGIAPEVVERIFDPFFSTKKEGKGSGIGLSVVHGIIQSHNGFINVDSTMGKGTAFEVYLPVYSGNIEIEDKIEPKRPIEKGDERILLVDDDKKVAFMVQHMLEKLGYQVSCHLKSPEALAAFKSDPQGFDIIITDLTMPELTGYQLSEKISQIRPDIPIVLCTGYGEHINKKKYDLKGIKGFLNKPVGVRDVSTLLRDILEQ